MRIARMNIPILMYHRVCADDSALSPWIVTASVFERQLEWLKARGYRSVNTDAFSATSAEANHPFEKTQSIALTFDDGYLDNYTIAFPLLRKHGFSATIFVVCDFERRINFWDHATPMAGAPLLRIEHIREMIAGGISFGAHGESHRPMTSLDDATAVRELLRSKSALESVLDIEVRSFAYPYGAVDGRAKSLVRRAGYRTAFAVNSGPLHLEEDPYEIRRVLAGNSAHDLYMFSKVTGLEKTLRARLS
jgi:peptidoglycan/xylan/chitin deacetylase (PgdA/CDA1 family)